MTRRFLILIDGDEYVCFYNEFADIQNFKGPIFVMRMLENSESFTGKSNILKHLFFVIHSCVFASSKILMTGGHDKVLAIHFFFVFIKGL